MTCNNEILWVDREYNEFTSEQISDRYLLNIIQFVCNGGGYISFVDHKIIYKLFREATDRGLHHEYSLRKALDMLDEKVYQVYLEYLEEYNK